MRKMLLFSKRGPCYIHLFEDNDNQTAEHYSVQWGEEKGFLSFIQKQPEAKAVIPSAKLGWEVVFRQIRNEARETSLYVYYVARGFGGIANELVNEHTCANLHYVGADIHSALVDIVTRIPHFVGSGLLIRWDITRRIPVREKFDYVLCRASLHHTPDPRESFRSL